MIKMLFTASAVAISLFFAPVAAQAENHVYTLVIKDHKFSPEEIRVPADTKIKLIVDNQDVTPEEFESHDLNREKVIAGNSKATLMLGPLKKGSYSFMGEFNEATAKGILIAE